MAICDECRENKPNVRVVLDPYALEVNGEEVKRALCEECEQERRDSI